MKQTPWTQEETDRLLMLIRTMEWRDAARELGRSFGSVQGRITWLRSHGAVFPSRTRSGGASEKHLSNEQVAWIRQHLETASREEMAAHLGIASSTLLRKLNKLGLSQSRQIQQRWTASDDAELLSLAGTYSAEEIARRMRRTRAGVLWRAARLSLSLRIQFKWTPGELTELRRLVGEGCTSTEIATHLGKKPGTIRAMVRKLGLRLLTHGRPSGKRKPPAEQKLPYVATPKHRERQGIYRAPRIAYTGRVAWCGRCCAPVVDSPKGWAEHNARVHVAPRRVA